MTTQILLRGAQSETAAEYFYDYAAQDPINGYDLDGTLVPKLAKQVVKQAAKQALSKGKAAAGAVGSAVKSGGPAVGHAVVTAAGNAADATGSAIETAAAATDNYVVRPVGTYARGATSSFSGAALAFSGAENLLVGSGLLIAGPLVGGTCIVATGGIGIVPCAFAGALMSGTGAVMVYVGVREQRDVYNRGR